MLYMHTKQPHKTKNVLFPPRTHHHHHHRHHLYANSSRPTRRASAGLSLVPSTYPHHHCDFACPSDLNAPPPYFGENRLPHPSQGNYVYVTSRAMRGGYISYSTTLAIRSDKTQQGKNKTNAFSRRTTWQASNTCISYRTVSAASVRAHDFLLRILKKNHGKPETKKQNKNLGHAQRACPSSRSPIIAFFATLLALRIAAHATVLPCAVPIADLDRSINDGGKWSATYLITLAEKLICRSSQPVDTPPLRASLAAQESTTKSSIAASVTQYR